MRHGGPQEAERLLMLAGGEQAPRLVVHLRRRRIALALGLTFARRRVLGRTRPLDLVELFLELGNRGGDGRMRHGGPQQVERLLMLAGRELAPRLLVHLSRCRVTQALGLAFARGVLLGHPCPLGRGLRLDRVFALPDQGDDPRIVGSNCRGVPQFGESGGVVHDSVHAGHDERDRLFPAALFFLSPPFRLYASLPFGFSQPLSLFLVKPASFFLSPQSLGFLATLLGLFTLASRRARLLESSGFRRTRLLEASRLRGGGREPGLLFATASLLFTAAALLLGKASLFFLFSCMRPAGHLVPNLEQCALHSRVVHVVALEERKGLAFLSQCQQLMSRGDATFGLSIPRLMQATLVLLRTQVRNPATQRPDPLVRKTKCCDRLQPLQRTCQVLAVEQLLNGNDAGVENAPLPFQFPRALDALAGGRSKRIGLGYRILGVLRGKRCEDGVQPDTQTSAVVEHQRSADLLAQMEADRKASQTPESRAAAAAAIAKVTGALKRVA